MTIDVTLLTCTMLLLTASLSAMVDLVRTYGKRVRARTDQLIALPQSLYGSCIVMIISLLLMHQWLFAAMVTIAGLITYDIDSVNREQQSNE